MKHRTEKRYPTSKDDYELYEEVGQGVSAVVHRALCKPFNETVAVKILDLERCNSNLDGIRREVQTMSLIDHPNVLRAHCSFIAGQHLWVIMPYMSGGSCLHIMKSSFPDGFEEPVIATFLRETLKALEYLHSQGHIHRDVKAGNILVDGSGAVKLADFGVSACMFDSGDRQRSRNTFVGTPCWMAPEVMEQLNGYDFKADIWSFGITALELAHGHAPFSKYPPMKVLLMTLQNAPPGLDYERDRRFSKSFKEMVAMCLVKDPSKRPSSAKLLKHHFFKHARSYDYIARTILHGLAPLGQRFEELKRKEKERMEQNKMAYEEKEERSQSEYIRGISAWNFDLEDLKAQASLIQDDEEVAPTKDHMVDSMATKGNKESSSVPSKFESSDPTSFLGTDTLQKDGNQAMPIQLDPLSSSQHHGHDDAITDNPHWKEYVKSQHNGSIASYSNRKDDNQLLKDKRHDLDKEHKIVEDFSHGRRVLSGPLNADIVLASSRGVAADLERDRYQRRPQQRNFSGPLIATGSKELDSFSDPSRMLGNLDDKSKGLIIQQKGRFKVTSDEIDHKEALPTRRPCLSLLNNSATVSTSAIFPTLQSILEQNKMQRDQIINLIKHLTQDSCSNTSDMKFPCLSNADKVEAGSERELELLHIIAELQQKISSLVDELQKEKKKNFQLEQQLHLVSSNGEDAANNI
eukprot:TRINITY_DN4953_c0_g1_i1.p1 TRINITY_DN4953_c0_g1~~TRINITY_DN4953_c0_g1_i1.p1  ORF type:complete len:691 (-),score=163.16 TRINITY_DN4953_c0_g1_i1:508-2580(-)